MWQIGAALGAMAGGQMQSLLGGVIEQDQTRKLTHEQMDMQREFAQQGIQWKVADAKAAGLHPLAALGAQTHSYSPQYVQGSDYGLKAMGQQSAALGMMMMEQQIKGLELDNAAKAAGLAGLGSRGVTGLPAGLAGSGVTVSPREVTASNTMGTTAGAQAMFDRYIDDQGWLHYAPNERLSDLISDSLPHQLMFYGKEIVKYLTNARGKQPPDFDPPVGKRWKFYKSMGMWRAVDEPSFYRGKVPGAVTPYYDHPNWKRRK